MFWYVKALFKIYHIDFLPLSKVRGFLLQDGEAPPQECSDWHWYLYRAMCHTSTSPFSYSQTCSTFRTTGHIATARASLSKRNFVSNSLIVFSLSAIVFFADSRSDCVLSKVCDSSLLLFSSCVMMWVGVFMRLITHRIAQIWFFWCGWYECTRQVLKSP